MRTGLIEQRPRELFMLNQKQLVFAMCSSPSRSGERRKCCANCATQQIYTVSVWDE